MNLKLEEAKLLEFPKQELIDFVNQVVLLWCLFEFSSQLYITYSYAPAISADKRPAQHSQLARLLRDNPADRHSDIA